jgi:hypothetical protein
MMPNSIPPSKVDLEKARDNLTNVRVRTVSIMPRARPSDASQLRSLRPMAASLRPSPNMEPSQDASPDRPRRSRHPIAVALLALAVAVVGAREWRSHRVAQTRTMTPQVVSGHPGLRETQLGVHERWLGPLTMTLDPSLDQIDPKAKDAVSAAVATWGAAHVGTPRASLVSDLTPGKAAQDGVSRILYGPIDIAGHERDVAVTIAYADTNSGEVHEADMILNSAYAFTVVDDEPAKDERSKKGNACGKQYDVQNVATHETGHVFGLGEDVDDSAATMYLRSGPCETNKRALTASDQGAMASLYAEPAPANAATTTAGCGGAAQIASGSPTGALWMAAALASLIGRRKTLRQKGAKTRRGF